MSPATHTELKDAGLAVRVRWRHNLSRWAIGAVAGAASVPALGWTPALLWTAAWAATQVAEFFVLGRVAQGTEVTRARLGAIVAVLASSSFVFCALSVLFWTQLGERGGAVAALIVMGSLMNALVVCNASRRLFIALAAPAFFFLALQPTIALLKTHDYSLLAGGFACAGCVMLAAMLMLRHVEGTRKAEQRARAELQDAADRAEAAVAAKSGFMAVVGHELRTPISGVLAAAGELERSSDPQIAEHGRMIADSGRLMRVVLNDLLDLAKIEAGKMSVEATAFDVRELVDQACRFWSVEAHDKGLDMGFRGVERLPRWIEGDPTRLRQILNNLISNAVKFTETGGVSVSVQVGDDSQGRSVLRLAVSDTGPGISREAQAMLFKPFSQGDVSTARLHGGTGLGLAISRRLATLMDGELDVESHPGAGSTFTLKLPLRVVSDRAPAAGPVDPAARAEAAQGLRVLVCDDHAINRRAVRLLLSPLEPELSEAASGAEALEAMASSVFDLVLMDVRMPEMDGMEATRRLRAGLGPNRDTPVLAITASTDPEDVRACLASGMTGFVAKPLDARDLLHAVTEAVAPPALAPAEELRAEAA